MSDLCLGCANRRAADKAALNALFVPGLSAAQQAAVNRQAGELKAFRVTEEIAYTRPGGAQLQRRPLEHDWCGAQSDTNAGNYYFTDWLTTPTCPFFQPIGGGAPVAGNGKETTVAAGAPSRVVAPGTTVVAAPPLAAAPAPSAAPAALGPLGTAPSAAPSASPTPAKKEEWSLPLGTSYDLHAIAETTYKSALGVGSFVVDFKLDESSVRPSISGKGLAQTYLIFGGPGAGKTYYFKYLLSSLLDHPGKPGCLLLDPKGVLTPWLRDEVLAPIGRSKDLTVLEAGASHNAFNVLGRDLPSIELGRLLSEVVLAGASGIDEGWAVLISDLLEASAIVISAEEGFLTARQLLKDILYRADFKYQDGRHVKEYPIVLRARRVARTTKDVDVRIACDRITEFFESTEDRQRRFVRQIIERTLGELMSPDWQYLSSTKGDESVYSGIIHDHRVVTVAVGQSSPAFQRSMSTLVKSLFQQAVLSDLSHRQKADPTPFFIMACDEYAQAITEGQTGLVSDSRFFSLSREAGCMSLLALQSVATGRSRFPADMHDRWDGILGNVTVKMFMRVNDVETAEMGSKLAGTQHAFIPITSTGYSTQGASTTQAVTMLEHPRVPSWYLTNRMEQGLALIHGTLDGQSVPTSMFVRAPKAEDVAAAKAKLPTKLRS
jgi:TraM recognition site of TraD and TraG